VDPSATYDTEVRHTGEHTGRPEVKLDLGALTGRGGVSIMDADLAGAGSALRIIEIIGYDRM